MPVIQKFLLILVLMHTDGSFTFEKRLVDGGCPPPELILMLMESRREKGEFIDWDGNCFPVVFKKASTI
jgi:hypothetical protein